MLNSTASVSSHRKFVSGDRVRGRNDENCPGSFRTLTGTVTDYVIGSGYFVRFDDGGEEYVYAHWLEAADMEQA
jgi:hypothetical protein